jgi:hypothetical protein
MSEDRGPDSPENRREFLFGAAGALAATWIATQWPAIAAAHAAATAAAGGRTALAFLSATEARDVEAIAAQLVPADQDPGAREAGALYFIDLSLTTWCSGHAADFRDGLRGFQAKFAATRPIGGFADADESTQQAFLRHEEKSDFFDRVRALTLIGLFAAPKYGGNRDGLGWRLIGFKDEHVFAPPFGYYDRDYPGFKVR